MSKKYTLSSTILSSASLENVNIGNILFSSTYQPAPLSHYYYNTATCDLVGDNYMDVIGQYNEKILQALNILVLYLQVPINAYNSNIIVQSKDINVLLFRYRELQNVSTAYLDDSSELLDKVKEINLMLENSLPDTISYFREAINNSTSGRLMVRALLSLAEGLAKTIETSQRCKKPGIKRHKIVCKECNTTHKVTRTDDNNLNEIVGEDCRKYYFVNLQANGQTIRNALSHGGYVDEDVIIRHHAELYSNILRYIKHKYKLRNFTVEKNPIGGFQTSSPDMLISFSKKSPSIMQLINYMQNISTALPTGVEIMSMEDSMKTLKTF